MPNILVTRFCSAWHLLVLCILMGLTFSAHALTITTETRVNSAADDAEENTTGRISLTSTDLELTMDRDNQVVGIRFNNVNVDQGTAISSAYIQFAVDEKNSEATTLQLAAEASDNAQTFNKTAFSISLRPRTTSIVSWTPAEWTVVSQAGIDQRTPDLTSILQEIINRPNWQRGNSIAIIITGSGIGKRVAQAYDYSAALAPLLHIEYTATGNQPATVAITSPSPGATAVAGTALTFTATAVDPEDGDISPTITWASSSDGNLGTGASVTATLSIGPHTVTASTVDTGGQAASATIAVYISTVGGSGQSLDRQVIAGTDDAEENTASGAVSLTSSDLEMVTDGSAIQIVGMRFGNIGIPPGSVVTNAWIQFTANEANSGATNLILQGQASANATSFTTASLNVSGRPRTAAQVNWSPLAWSVVGAAGAEQRTPDLAPIINEIISNAGWASGNSIAIIVRGNGKRNAKSQNGAPVSAPLLHIEYIDSGINVKPAVSAGPDATITLPVNTHNLDGTVTDDGRPDGSTLSTLWTHVGGTGTGTVSFGNTASVDTTFNVSANSGTYILRLTANDGEFQEYDDITVTVAPQSTGGTVQSITQINYFNTGFANLTSPLAIPATDPAGLVYHPPSGHLIIADSEINEISDAFLIVQANIFETPLTGGSTLNQWDITKKTGNESTLNREPTGITYCANDNHFYVSNDDARRIYRYAYDGVKFTAVDSFSTSGYSSDPEDITCDPSTGRLYVIGGSDKNILVLRYQGGFVLEQNLSLPITAGSASGVPSDPEGIAFDAGSGHLFVVSAPDKAIFEFTLSGLYIKKLSISGFSPAVSSGVQGITVGPSSNNTQGTSFYLADAMVDNDSNPNERDGRIYEVRINRVQ